MRNVFLFMMISLDGYFEGPDHDLSWHNAANDEFTQFANNQLDETDTLVFGHRTYDMMASFWPTPEARQEAKDTTTRMNALHKVVFTHTPFTADWKNSEVSTDPVTFMTELKNQPGKAVAVLGSPNLSLTLLEHGLLDELRIMINPVVLGSGSTLFAGLDERREFKLASTRSFDSGNVLLRYVRSSV
jgi:dihydrofolate reductase